MHSNEIRLQSQTTSSLKACCIILILCQLEIKNFNFKSVGVLEQSRMNVSLLFNVDFIRYL